MSRLGLPVPPGFVITTETCLDFFSSGKTLPAGVKQEYLEALAKVSSRTNHRGAGSWRQRGCLVKHGDWQGVNSWL